MPPRDILLALLVPALFVVMNGWLLRRMGRAPLPLVHMDAPSTAMWALVFPLLTLIGAAIPVFIPGYDYGLLIVIAGVINPPSAKKYAHWTNDALPGTFDDWLAGAKEHPGSWWPHWAEWLAARSGPKVAARDPEKGPLPAIEPAPGSYVKVRS